MTGVYRFRSGVFREGTTCIEKLLQDHAGGHLVDLRPIAPNLSRRLA